MHENLAIMVFNICKITFLEYTIVATSAMVTQVVASGHGMVVIGALNSVVTL